MQICSCCGSSEFDHAVEYPIDYEYGVVVEDTLGYISCRSCKTEWLMPRPNEAAIKSFYPDDYHAYQEGHDWLAAALVSMRAAQRRRYYRKLIPGDGEVYLFDVGAGDCRHFNDLLKTGHYVCSGIEINDDMARAGREQGFEVYSGTLETLDIADHANQYDIITMYHVLEHVEEPDTVMNQVFRMLRPGGVVVGQLPVKDSWEYRLFGEAWAGYHYPRHLQIFSRAGLEALMYGAGFGSVSLKSAPHCQTAISMQNKCIAMGMKLKPQGGRTSIYPALLALSLPFEILVTLLQVGGTLDFTCRKG